MRTKQTSSTVYEYKPNPRKTTGWMVIWCGLSGCWSAGKKLLSRKSLRKTNIVKYTIRKNHILYCVSALSPSTRLGGLSNRAPGVILYKSTGWWPPQKLCAQSNMNLVLRREFRIGETWAKVRLYVGATCYICFCWANIFIYSVRSRWVACVYQLVWLICRFIATDCGTQIKDWCLH